MNRKIKFSLIVVGVIIGTYMIVVSFTLGEFHSSFATIHGNGMNPTIFDGEAVEIDVHYKFNQIEKGDVIMFYSDD